MSEWERQTPEYVPGWYKAVFKRDEWVHIMGTTAGGYDIFYGVIWGTRTAIRSGLIITFLSLLIGVVVGSVAAYYGGKVDDVIMRIVDIFMTLPFLLAALILAAVLIPKIGRSNLPAIIALAVFGWMSYARLIRGDILSVKERDYVLAARVIGVKNTRYFVQTYHPECDLSHSDICLNGYRRGGALFCRVVIFRRWRRIGICGLGTDPEFCAGLDFNTF